MRFKTENSPLKWTHISGKGSPKYGKEFTSDNRADFEYKASVVVSPEQSKSIKETIMEFWNANKPAKIAAPSSTFLKEEMVNSDKTDDYGRAIKKPSGVFYITASTNVGFTKDGEFKPTKIAILNSKGVAFPDSHKLVMGDVGVADGSKGVIHGTLAITEYEGKAYVKFYLKGVQFSKFIPYEGNSVDAEDLGTDEDDGSSVEDDGMTVDSIDESNKSKPEL